MVQDCIYRESDLPVLQNVSYASKAEATRAPLGDVELVQDTSSGLVFNYRFDPVLLDYDATYQNEQACSKLFRDHLTSVLSLVQRHHADGKSIVEIGCGKAYFFEMMQDAGMAPVGFDPAYEGANPNVRKEYFDPGNAVAYDLIVLRHVLEHIPRPLHFLSGLAAHAKAGTRIYIEVPCFDWIVENRAFYDIFYEHCNYFTLDVLAGAFGSILESGRSFGGQYLHIVAELASFRLPESYRGPRFPPLDFTDACEWAFRESTEDRPPLIWCAGAKGMTFSNILHRRGVALAGLVDINPAKQGRFVGMSGLPIYSPEVAMPLIEDGHEIYVMNPNYLPEILDMFRGKHVTYRCLA